MVDMVIFGDLFLSLVFGNLNLFRDSWFEFRILVIVLMVFVSFQGISWGLPFSERSVPFSWLTTAGLTLRRFHQPQGLQIVHAVSFKSRILLQGCHKMDQRFRGSRSECSGFRIYLRFEFRDRHSAIFFQNSAERRVGSQPKAMCGVVLWGRLVGSSCGVVARRAKPQARRAKPQAWSETINLQFSIFNSGFARLDS